MKIFLKKNLLFWLGLGGLGGLGSLGACDVLEKPPLTDISPANFYRTADDAESGLTSCYQVLQYNGCYSQDLPCIGDIPGDNCQTDNNDVRPLDNFTWTPSYDRVERIFRDNFSGVNRCNYVLKYVPGVEMDAARRRQILGEAYFLRALYYYNLVTCYGGVPLRLEPAESGDPAKLNPARATAEAVYARVIDDLTTAEPLLSATPSPIRVSQPAAAALLARVQLGRREWAAALAAAQRVVQGGQYRLQGSFRTLFPADNKPESIFEVQFGGAGTGGNSLPDLALPSPPATYSFPKFNIPTLNLITAADTANDLRWSYQGTNSAGRSYGSIVVRGRLTDAGNDSGPFCYKWTSSAQPFNSDNNTYVLRYAEVLLTAAEAQNELNNPAAAVGLLNQIRTRAGLTNLPATLTQAQVRAATDLERRLELAFEGFRWPDLLRYARHTAATPAAAHAVTALDVIAEKRGARDANYFVLPIPQGEMNTNLNCVQNPGY